MTTTEKKGWAAIPLSIDLAGRHIKLKIGLGRGKQEFEKREVLKTRELKRELQREMKKAHLKI